MSRNERKRGENEQILTRVRRKERKRGERREEEGRDGMNKGKEVTK